jgi:L-lactate utilization protein LutB
MHSQDKIRKPKDAFENIISIQLEKRQSHIVLPVIHGSSRNQIQTIMKTFDQGINFQRPSQISYEKYRSDSKDNT